MKKVITCNVIALVLLGFSALAVQRIVETIISVEVSSNGIGASSYTDWWNIVIHNVNGKQIGSIRNYPSYVLFASLLMNLLFWIRYRVK